jgi:hypothetical protein
VPGALLLTARPRMGSKWICTAHKERGKHYEVDHCDIFKPLSQTRSITPGIMAQPISTADSLEETHQKLKHLIDTKRYIEEPEVLPWYRKDLDELKPRTRELFEQYCNLVSADVETHIKMIVNYNSKVSNPVADDSTAQ